MKNLTISDDLIAPLLLYSRRGVFLFESDKKSDKINFPEK